MATNHTENWGLNQWEAEDPVIRSDFNSDNQKIEEALNGIALNNCKLYMGSYVGTGVRAEGEVVLQFPFRPMVVFMHLDYLDQSNNIPAYYIFFRDKTKYYGCDSSVSNVTAVWGDDNLSIYCSSTTGVASMFNTEGSTYRYIALGI